MDLTATVCFSVAVCCIYRFIRLKQVGWLIMGIVLAGMTVFATVRFFMGY